MKTADVVMVLIGVAGLGLAGFAAFKAMQGPDLSQGPRAAAQPPPTKTVALPPAAQKTEDVLKDVGNVVQVGVQFIDGLAGAFDTIGKFVERF